MTGPLNSTFSWADEVDEGMPMLWALLFSRSGLHMVSVHFLKLICTGSTCPYLKRRPLPPPMPSHMANLSSNVCGAPAPPSSVCGSHAPIVFAPAQMRLWRKQLPGRLELLHQPHLPLQQTIHRRSFIWCTCFTFLRTSRRLKWLL